MQIGPDLDEDPRGLVEFGFARGDYMGFCRECCGQFIGDKRATVCEACAREDWQDFQLHCTTKEDQHG